MNRQIKPSLVIFCEGDTEEKYFSQWKEESENNDYTFSVQLIESNKNDALGLIEEAREIMKDYDYDQDKFFIVYDKNGYEKHKEAIVEASVKPEINIIISCICFEYWILLHFEKNSESFQKCKDVKNYLSDSGHLKGYKTGDPNLFRNIRDKIETAVEYASWIRFLQRNEIYRYRKRLFLINPFTNVDTLVNLIRDYKYQLFWTELGIDVDLSGLKLKVNSFNFENKRISLEILLVNNQDISYPVTMANKDYYIEDNRGRKHFPINVESLMILPN